MRGRAAATGHLEILRGNLAPDGAVAKITGKEGFFFEGPARVYDTEETALAGLERHEVKNGCLNMTETSDRRPRGTSPMPERRPVVGFVGLGRMGLPMARNLLAAGFPVVAFNRTAAKAEPLRAAGATIAAGVAELIAASGIVCVCLDRVEASREVFLGPEGVMARGRPGMIAIDHGTIGPDTAREIAAGLEAQGIAFLDAPVSGGPEGAEQGTLTIMAGGTDVAFAAVEPVMHAYGRTVVRMGEVGTGSLTKLVNQLLTFVHGAAAAEALNFAERNGLNLAALGSVLAVSFGQSRMLERTLGRVLTDNFEAGAALRLYVKDLGLVDQVARTVGADLPLTAAAEQVLAHAMEGGLSDRDIASLMQLLRTT